MKRTRRKKLSGKKKVKRSGRRQLTRREFLAGTTVAGVALGMPSLLIGCSSDDDSGSVTTPTPVPTSTTTQTPALEPRPRELRDLHFDFSLAEMGELQLLLPLSRSHRSLLSVHDDQSRAQAREQNPALRDVADEQLTHFCPEVDLPSDAFQLVTVRGRLSATGEAALASLHIHVPAEVRRVMTEFAAVSGQGKALSAKLRAYGVKDGGGQGVLQGADSYVTPFDAAAALVFQQPEIQNLNLDTGTTILDLINSSPCTAGDTSCQPFLNALAFQIAEMWPATTSGGWATLVPATDVDDNPVLDGEGNQVLSYQVADTIAQTAISVANEIRKTIANDMQFNGFNWHETTGMTVVDSSSATGQAVRGSAAGAADFDVAPEHPGGTTVHGVTFVDFTAQQTFPTPTPTGTPTVPTPTATRTTPSPTPSSANTPTSTRTVTNTPLLTFTPTDTLTPTNTPTSTPTPTSVATAIPPTRSVTVKIRNNYIRYLGVFVEYQDAAGNTLAVQDKTFPDTDRAKFIAFVSSNFTIMGIPLLGPLVPETSFEFSIPADASTAKVWVGSLGIGGCHSSQEAIFPCLLTILFNIAIPATFLVLGLAASASVQKNVESIALSNSGVIVTTLRQALFALGPDFASGVFGSANSKSVIPVLERLGVGLLKSVVASGGIWLQIMRTVAEAEIDEEAADVAAASFPPLEIALRVAALVASLTELLLTVTESLSSPAVFANKLTLTQTTTVSISKDPDDFQFPLTARHYQVTLSYDSSSVTYQQTGDIQPGRVDPIVVPFTKVPSGGTVTVNVYLTTEDNCIIGLGRDTENNDAVGPVTRSGTDPQIDIPIKEQLIPLLQSTQYDHVLKLEYDATNEQRMWAPTTAPTATQAALTCNDSALCGLTGITVSQRTGMAGYAYEANTQSPVFCGQTTGGVMHLVQNVFLGQDANHGPDDGLKQLPCGYQEPAGIVYDRLGPASGIGQNFLMQPIANNEFDVLSVALAGTTPFDLTNPLSWGRFTQALDSYALVSTGYVVGVNRQTHKMQILELAATAVDRDQAPEAVAYAVQKMGFGTRAGLLNEPVAVTTLGATIFILEQGNLRIQAADTSGNPVLWFQNGLSSFVLLQVPAADVVYLDLGVDGVGYLYVLWFVNGGLMANDYGLDIYDPQGNFLTRTTGMAAAKLAVDTFRNVYTLNYEKLAGAPRVEPSLSQWEPSTPEGCPTPPPTQTPTS